jgi:hypothetical protein
MKLESGQVYMTRNGYKAVAHEEVCHPPTCWWRMRDERGYSWLAKADGSALSDQNEHPLDLVGRVHLMIRNLDLPKRRGCAPEWK